MKILYVSASIIPSHYANSVHVMKMCAALAQNENEVVLLGEKGKEEVDIFNFYNVAPLFNVEALKKGKMQIIRKISRTMKLAKDRDVIYTRYTLAAFLCSFVLKKQVIYEYHGVMNLKINIMLEALLSYKKNIRHVFITNSLYKSYCALRPKLVKGDCVVLPDAADDPNVVYIPPFRNGISIGYIGSFQKGKGVELVAQIAARFPQCKFHIIGGKEDEIEIMRSNYPSDNVIWHGFLPQKEAMKILHNDIDIALLPNKKDMLVGKKQDLNIGAYTSPMKLFEYMSYGKIIVASRLPVLEEVLSDGKNSYMANPEDIDDWEKVIKNIINNPTESQNVGQNAYLDFKKNYTWRARAEKALKGLAYEE